MFLIYMIYNSTKLSMHQGSNTLSLLPLPFYTSSQSQYFVSAEKQRLLDISKEIPAEGRDPCLINPSDPSPPARSLFVVHEQRHADCYFNAVSTHARPLRVDSSHLPSCLFRLTCSPTPLSISHKNKKIKRKWSTLNQRSSTIYVVLDFRQFMRRSPLYYDTKQLYLFSNSYCRTV